MIRMHLLATILLFCVEAFSLRKGAELTPYNIQNSMDYTIFAATAACPK